VHVVLGDRWQSAAPVIQILAWVGLLQSLQRLNSSVLQARDQTGPLLRYSVIVLTASLVAFVVGLRWGIVGIAAGYAISSTLVEPYYTWLTTRALEMPLMSFLRSLSGVAQATLAMVAVVLPAELLLRHGDVAPPVRLLLCIALGAATYVPCCLWRAPEVRTELRGLIMRRRRRDSYVVATENAT
jgi:PST family polysaccharide transporter